MDVMMPDMSGDEVIAEIREDDNLATIPYVFMTAIVSKTETEEMGNTIGGNEFLAKPVKIKERILV